MDGPFNVQRGEGMSRGQVYAKHFRTDDNFYGARLPTNLDGGRGWSGRRLGLERYSLPGRLWHGAPLPLKAAVGGGSAGAALGVYDNQNPGIPQ